jgi:heme A synthase
MEAGTSPSPAEEAGYSGATVAGAILATLLFPLIALIAALLLQGGEQSPSKRAQLRTWAWVSGIWTVLGVLLVALAVGAIGGHAAGSTSRSGPCQGGPDESASGKDISGNGTKFVFPCVFGGTATVKFPKSSTSP